MKSSSKPTESKESLCFQFAPLFTNKLTHFKPVALELQQKTKSAKNRKTTPKQLIYPQWNNDKLCYTPAFIIPQDQGAFQKIKDTFREGFLDNIKNCFDESTNIPLSNIRMPYPRGQHYCGVCKTTYSDFQDHTSSNPHLSNCLNSPYTRHIAQFCEIYGNTNSPKNQDSTKTKNDSSEKNPIQKSFRTKQQAKLLRNTMNRLEPVISKPTSSSSSNIQQEKISATTLPSNVRVFA